MELSGTPYPKKMKGKLPLSVLLVIPVYNHGSTLRHVVKQALDDGWPVLVVDDGSTDGGPERITDLPCRIHHTGSNQGKGVAILAGAEIAAESGYRAIVTVDADGQLDPREAHLLVDATAGDWPVIVVGSRRMDQESIPNASIFGRAFSNFWVRLECGQDLPDTQSGMRLYPVDQLLQLHVRSRRYDFEVEVLVQAVWAGIPIRSVPVSVDYSSRNRQSSHFHKVKDNLRLTAMHTRLVLRALCPWPHRRLLQRPDKWHIDKSLYNPVRLLKYLCREHSSPLLLGVAAWMGIFLGSLPLIACHTIVIIYVTHKLHLNKVAAVGASQFCCPPIVPVVCIEVGHFMRSGHLLLNISWETLFLQIPYRLWEWLLGSLVVGPVFGIIVGGITYFGVARLRAGR